MLVLSRRSGETVNIGKDILIKVIEIDRNVVRIGFEAPKDINIVRTEILDRENIGNV